MSNASPDFTYHISACGTVYTLYPENTQAEHNWKILDQEFSGGKIPFFFWKAIRSQLRKAGFSVQKAKPVKKQELDAIFSEMEALGIC